MGDPQYYLTMAITGVGTFVLAALGFILAFNNRITEAYNMGKIAKDQSDENKQSLILLAAKIELVARDFHSMEVEISSKISALTTMTETSHRTIENLEKLVRELSGSTMKVLSELVRSTPPR